MIEIIANNKKIVLPDNFVLSINKESPLFFGKKQVVIPGEYSVPANVPALENKSIMGHAEYLNNWDNFRTIENATINIGGNCFSQGAVSIKSASQSTYNIQFIGGAGDLQIWKNKYLKDYSYTETDVPLRTFSDWPAHVVATQNTNDHDHLVHPWFEFDVETDDLVTRHTVSFYIETILKEVCTKEGYTLETTFFEDDIDHKKLLLVSNIDTDIEQQEFELYCNNYLPNITVANFIKEFAKFFLLYVIIDSKQKAVKIGTHQEVQANFTNTIDWSSRMVGKFTKKGNITDVSSFKFDYADDPLMGNRGVGVLQRKLLGSFSAEMFFPDDAKDGDWVFLVTDQNYYRRHEGVWRTAPEDAFTIFPNQDVSTRSQLTEGIDINVKCLPTWMWVDFDGVTAPIFAKINTADTIQTEIDYFYIGIYRGITTSIKGIDFPFVGVDNYNVDGTVDNAKLTMNWFSEQGLFERYWRQWLEVMGIAIDVDSEMESDYNDIFNYDPKQSYQLWDDHSGGYHFFLHKNFKIVVNQHKVQRTTQQLVQIRPIE